MDEEDLEKIMERYDLTEKDLPVNPPESADLKSLAKKIGKAKQAEKKYEKDERVTREEMVEMIRDRDQEIRDLKQQLKEEKRLHQKCREGLEGWNPPEKLVIDSQADVVMDMDRKIQDLKQQVEYHEQNEKELRQELREKEEEVEKLKETDLWQKMDSYRYCTAEYRRMLKEKERKLESKKDRVEELKETLGKRNKELRAIKSVLDSDTKELAKQKETTQFWGEEAMKLEQLLREKNQQPKVEEILAELIEYDYDGSISMRRIKEILRKHLE